MTLGGIIFAVYSYFKKPQEKSDVVEAVLQERFTQFDRELANLRDNHIHSLSESLNKHICESQAVALTSAEKMGAIEAKLNMLIGQK